MEWKLSFLHVKDFSHPIAELFIFYATVLEQ